MTDPRTVTMIGALAVAFAATAGACVVLHSAGRTGRYRHYWRLLGASLVAWGAGSGLSFLSYFGSAPGSSNHSMPNVAYMLTTVLYVAAMVLHPALSPRVVRVRAIANGMIVAASISVVLWYAAGRQLYDLTGDLGNTVATLAYPASDIVLVHLGLTAARRARFTETDRFPAARAAAWSVSAAFLAFLIGDVRELFDQAYGFTATLPGATEVCWIAGIALIVRAVRTVRGEGSRRRHPSHAGRRPDDDRRLATALSLAPVGAAVLGGIAGTLDWLVRGVLDPTGMMMLSAVISMVLARQSLTLTDNQQLGVSLQQAVEDLEHQATHDGLTGLPNRTGLIDRIRSTVERGDGGPGRAALLFVDLDHLKPVNDSLGHAAGDTLLCTTAERLLERVGPAVTRFGGDEFVILVDDLPRLDPVASVELLGRKIVEDTSLPIDIEGHLIRPSVSVGIALAEPGTSPEELMRRADLALYRAKSEGRRCVATYDPDLQLVDARQQIDLEYELRRAIRNDEFEIHYQPVVELSSGRVAGVESLLRWRHPERGVLTPDVFLDEAAKSGLLGTIGEQTLMRACADVAAVSINTGMALTVAVNLSTTELTDPRVVTRVRSALDTYGLEPTRLTIEITEDVVVDDTIRNTIDDLRAVGVHLAIDDFGTGNSSLRQLGSYPARTLKIDRSFVMELGEDPRATAVVRAVLGLAGRLGLRTVGEGIETREQALALAALGCDFGQGWLFAPAMPVDELELHLGANPGAQPFPSPRRDRVAPASEMIRPSTTSTGGRSSIAPTT